MKLIPLLLLLVYVEANGQVKTRIEAGKSDSLLKKKTKADARQSADIKSLLQGVEQGIISGAASTLGNHFAKQVSMSIPGNEPGYYSSGQALSILQGFFAVRHPTQFSFTRVNENPPAPFATGRMIYAYRGSKESVQIYVALARQDAEWVITQLNIY